MELDSLNERQTLTLDSEEDQKRPQWDTKLQSLLTTVGYIVSVGNLWRFPYICVKNGGGAFLIPFVLCGIFIVFPLFLLELSLGQFTGTAIHKCLEVCPLLKGLGFGMMIIQIICVYYIMIMTWTMYYLGNSFISPLLWTHCDKSWNTEHCNDVINSTDNSTKSLYTRNLTIKYTTSTGEFFEGKVLQLSTGIEDFGNVNIPVLLCLIGAWSIVFLCVMKGVKSIGKVVYVTATLPYVLLIILLVRSLLNPGAIDGIKILFIPDLAKLKDVNVRPGLAYVVYPEVVSTLPLPNLWAVLFFLMIFCLVIDSTFGTYEPLITVVCDSFKIAGRHRVKAVAIICTIFLIMSIPFTFQNGFFVFQLIDWYLITFCIPVFGILECLIFGWIYGADRFSKDIELMTNRPLPVFVRICWCFVTPLSLMMLLIAIIALYEPPSYGDYKYPVAATTCGFILSMLPMLPISLVALIEIRKAEGDTFIKKVKNAARPSKLWRPNSSGNVEEYHHDEPVDSSFFSVTKRMILPANNTV